jgi:hypothetical protein
MEGRVVLVNDLERKLEKQAKDLWDTTPGDVINAVKTGNLYDPFSEDFFLQAKEGLPEDHPWLNDDDPDERLGWHWQDNEPIAEQA